MPSVFVRIGHCDSGDRGIGIVVADARGHPSEEQDRSNISVLEGFSALTLIGHNERRIRKALDHREKHYLAQLHDALPEF